MGYSLHTSRRSFLYFIYAPLRQILECAEGVGDGMGAFGWFGAGNMGMPMWSSGQGKRELVRLRSLKEAGINV